MCDEVDELLGEVDVRLLERTDRHRTAATGPGRAESCDAAVARFDPEAVARATKTFVRPELRDGELADGDLVAVRVQTANGAVAVDGDAREVARRISVLRLARNVRGTRELRGAVEARAAARDRYAVVERDRLTRGGADEVRRDGGRRRYRVEGAVGREGERAGADFDVGAGGSAGQLSAVDESVIVPGV